MDLYPGSELICPRPRTTCLKHCWLCPRYIHMGETIQPIAVETLEVVSSKDLVARWRKLVEVFLISSESRAVHEYVTLRCGGGETY